VRQERGDLVAAHFSGMALVVKENEATRPMHIGLLGPIAVMPAADRVAQKIEQAPLGGRRPNIMICHGFDLSQGIEQETVCIYSTPTL
jgi:hypothetical protein